MAREKSKKVYTNQLIISFGHENKPNGEKGAQYLAERLNNKVPNTIQVIELNIRQPIPQLNFILDEDSKIHFRGHCNKSLPTLSNELRKSDNTQVMHYIAFCKSIKSLLPEGVKKIRISIDGCFAGSSSTDDPTECFVVYALKYFLTEFEIEAEITASARISGIDCTENLGKHISWLPGATNTSDPWFYKQPGSRRRFLWNKLTNRPDIFDAFTNEKVFEFDGSGKWINLEKLRKEARNEHYLKDDFTFLSNLTLQELHEAVFDKVRNNGEDGNWLLLHLALNDHMDLLKNILFQLSHLPSEITQKIYENFKTDSNTGNKSLIHILAEKGMFELVNFLLENHPNLIDSIDLHHQTPLIWAAANGRIEIVKYLLERKANLKAATYKPKTEDHGKTALIWAIEKGHKTIADLLIEANLLTTYEVRKLKEMANADNKNLIAYLAKKGFFNLIDITTQKYPYLLDEKEKEDLEKIRNNQNYFNQIDENEILILYEPSEISPIKQQAVKEFIIEVKNENETQSVPVFNQIIEDLDLNEEEINLFQGIYTQLDLAKVENYETKSFPIRNQILEDLNLNINTMTLQFLEEAEKKWKTYLNSLQKLEPVTQRQIDEKESLIEAVSVKLSQVIQHKEEINLCYQKAFTELNQYQEKVKALRNNFRKKIKLTSYQYVEYTQALYATYHVMNEIKCDSLYQPFDNTSALPSYTLDELKKDTNELKTLYQKSQPIFIIKMESEKSPEEQYQAYLKRIEPLITDRIQAVEKLNQDNEIPDYVKKELWEEMSQLLVCQENAKKIFEEYNQQHNEIRITPQIPEFSIDIDSSDSEETQYNNHLNKLQIFTNQVNELAAYLQTAHIWKVTRNRLQEIAFNTIKSIDTSRESAKIKHDQYVEKVAKAKQEIENYPVVVTEASLSAYIRQLKNIKNEQFPSLTQNDKKVLNGLVNDQLQRIFITISGYQPNQGFNWILSELKALNNKNAHELIALIDNRKQIHHKDAEILFPVLLATFKAIQYPDLVNNDEAGKALQNLILYQKASKDSWLKWIAWGAIAVLLLLTLASIVALAAPAFGVMAVFSLVAKVIVDLIILATTAITTIGLGGGIAAGISAGTIAAISVLSVSTLGAGGLIAKKVIGFFHARERQQELQDIHDIAHKIFNLSPKNNF